MLGPDFGGGYVGLRDGNDRTGKRRACLIAEELCSAELIDRAVRAGQPVAATARRRNPHDVGYTAATRLRPGTGAVATNVTKSEYLPGPADEPVSPGIGAGGTDNVGQTVTGRAYLAAAAVTFGVAKGVNGPISSHEPVAPRVGTRYGYDVGRSGPTKRSGIAE